MINLHDRRLEIGLYALAIGLALGLRLLNLGASPLSDAEAAWALEALRISGPLEVANGFGPQPGYILINGFAFLMFGANDFLARLWPALAGTLPVIVVYLLRKRLGNAAALILAFGLALDPGMTAVSRQAGGPMPALSCLLAAAALWAGRKPVLAGIAAALALLGGPAVWPGILALTAAKVAPRLHLRASSAESLDSGGETPETDVSQGVPAHTGAPPALRQAGLAALVSLGIAEAIMILYPNLPAAVFGGPLAYLRGWTTPSEVSISTLLLALAAFQALPLAFALVRLGRLLFNSISLEGQDLKVESFSLTWAAAALLLALLYPARQVADLVWVIPPLWILAARELAQYLPDRPPHVMSYLQGALVVLLGGFFQLTLIGVQQTTEMPVSWAVIQAVLLAGILLLGMLTTSLVALGWSWEISRDGSVWGVATLLLFYSIGAMWGAAQLRPNQPQELWGQGAGSGQARLLMSTVDDLSLWNRGIVGEIDIVSIVDTPSLRWALRDYHQARFLTDLPDGKTPAGESPALVITHSDMQSPELTASYRGQDFVWWVRPGWQGGLPPDPKAWFTFRRALLTREHLILWARTDMFPGAAESQLAP